MGVCICLKVSKSVTKAEWDKVFAETMVLAECFSLAERKEKNIRGIDVICLVPSVNRESKDDFDEVSANGWCADGDYVFMRSAERYFLPKDLVDDGDVLPDAGDAILGVLPCYLDYDDEDERFNNCYSLWGDKTQGQPYHMYLLAIACLITERLGRKAYVYGDITRGQCYQAVEWANQCLGQPIQVPDQCDLERLYTRVAALDFSDSEKLSFFQCFYMGTKDAEYWAFVGSHFSKETCSVYWRDVFKDSRVGTLGFDHDLFECLSSGFLIGDLCKIVNFEGEDGKTCYDEFITAIMDSKLHVKEKDCRDSVSIDRESAELYGIKVLFAQFLLVGAKNRKVNRYIPIEEIRKTLKAELGEKCDVDLLIDEYLEKERVAKNVDVMAKDITEKDFEQACESDPAGVFNQFMDKKKQELQESRETYDISEWIDLRFYEEGDTVEPHLLDSVRNLFAFCQELIKEEDYQKLMKETPEERCRWLVYQNRYILIRDKDWEDIFADICENNDSFARYYPMVRVRITSENLGDMMKAIVLNNDLYAMLCKNFLGESA